MTTDLTSRIPRHYWGYLGLLLWGVLSFLLLHHLPYNLDDNGAKALLLDWSIADGVASSAVTFGAPDLRVLLYLPTGYLWTGSVVAPKVFTLLCFAWGLWVAYHWTREKFNDECALLACGMLLLSPLLLEQVDMLAAAPWLFIATILSGEAETAYRSEPRPFGGFYFAQLALSALAVSLHPAGLGLPLAVLYAWHKDAVTQKQKQYFFGGLIFVSVAAVLLKGGWHGLHWFANPLYSLSTVLLGSDIDQGMSVARWLLGGLLLAALLFVLARQHRAMLESNVGRAMLFATLLGLFAADQVWALLAFATLLLYGFPLALMSGDNVRGGGIVRTVLVVLVFIVATLFMQVDRTHYHADENELSAEDQIIKSYADEVKHIRQAVDEGKLPEEKARFRVASQWPSRTMISCGCDTLPLPPATAKPEDQLPMLKSITHVMFDPRAAENLTLAHNFSALGGGVLKTVSLMPGGIILENQSVDLSTHKTAPPPPEEGLPPPPQ
jgi:hypothetical protein